MQHRRRFIYARYLLWLFNIIELIIKIKKNYHKININENIRKTINVIKKNNKKLGAYITNSF